MKYQNTLILLIAIAFASGIYIASLLSEILPLLLPLVCFLLVLLLLIWANSRKNLFNSNYFGITVCFFFLCLGGYNYQTTVPKHQDTHYTHLQIYEPSFLQIKVNEILKPDRYNNKYIVTIEAINQTSTQGRALLAITKDSTTTSLKIDQIFVLHSQLQPIALPKNPYQFNYKEYLKTLNVYAQIKINTSEILVSKQGPKSFRAMAEDTREYIINKLKATSIHKKERAILQALLLGQKRDIDPQQYQDYIAAGAIHILAVSGLHVGIIYGILLLVFYPLTRFRKGKILQSFCIVICLWVFAFITGLSASVTRAVTMFTFFAIAQSLHRKTSTINTLGLSFVSLLIYNPLFLFYVGFQLSYLAVLAIITIQPKLYSYSKPTTKVGDILWGTFTVTFAAQLGLAPLSLYYFHQFPGLFFVTNLIVLPFLSIILSGGLFIIVLACLSILPNWLALLYGDCINLLNRFIHWVAVQDSYIFKDISFSKTSLLGWYLVLTATILLWKKGTYKNLLFWLSSFAILLVVIHFEQWNRKPNQLVIFQKNRSSLIAVKLKNEAVIFSSDSVLTNSQKLVSTYKTGANISEISIENKTKIFKYKDTHILILDSLDYYPKSIKNPIVLLTHSTRTNLERLLDSIKPIQIIADGSNYKSYVNRWRETCKNKKIPFHSTYKKGAFILD